LPPDRPILPPPAGPDATDQALLKSEGARHRALAKYTAEDAAYMDRFKFWVSLDNATKAQLAMDIKNAQADGPLWAVHLRGDAVAPPLLVRCPVREMAPGVYREVCGIRGVDLLKNNGDPWEVTPYGPYPDPAA
jgi:hypothetical protein